MQSRQTAAPLFDGAVALCRGLGTVGKKVLKKNTIFATRDKQKYKLESSYPLMWSKIQWKAYGTTLAITVSVIGSQFYVTNVNISQMNSFNAIMI